MNEILHQFKEGPHDVLEFNVKTEKGKAIIEINNGNLGRLTVEDMETVEELRESLDKIEAFLAEQERRKEEL